VDITDRIIEFCNKKKIKQIELEKAGCGSKGTINNVFRKKNDPSSRFLEAFVKAFPVDARWLLTGEEQIILEDSRINYGFCKECIKKEGVIEHLKRESQAKDKRIEELLIKLAQHEGRAGSQAGKNSKAS
jgi:transcriptional regulator with XRE-family HTH domain